MVNGQTTSEFILSLPADTPAKEVIAEAKESGLKFSSSYVYAVRRKANLTRKRRRRRPAASASPTILVGRAIGTERDFRRLALELGLGKAKKLLQETTRKVAAIIAGK